MIVFTYSQREEKYVEVNGVDNFKIIHKMIQKEMPWGGDQYYYVVKLPKVDPNAEDQFYPLPLVYASKEEQEVSAKEVGKEVPSEMILKSVRNKIATLICDGPLRVNGMSSKWFIPAQYRDLVYQLAGKPINYDEGDVYIAQILRHRGEDVLMQIIEEAGYCLFDGEAGYTIDFTEKDLGTWTWYDEISHEATCLHFAAYCCAMRANSEDYVQPDIQAVDEFICRLREWLDNINVEQ